MANMFKNKKCLAIFSLLMVFSCSNEIRHSNNANFSDNYIDVCELKRNASLYYDKTVKVKGEIKGFHQLILYSKNCDNENNLILLDSSYTDFSKYFKDVDLNTNKSSDVTGQVYLSGKLKKNAGTIFEYGELLYDTKSNKILKERKKNINVDKLTSIQIDLFNSQY